MKNSSVYFVLFSFYLTKILLYTNKNSCFLKFLITHLSNIIIKCSLQIVQ